MFWSKSWLSLFVFSFSLTAVAELPADKGATNACAAWLQIIKPDFRLTIDNEPEHAEYIRALENKIDKRTLAVHSRLRPTQVRGLVRFERILFLLARGDSDELLGLVRSSANEGRSSYEDLTELAPEIDKLQKVTNPTEEQQVQLTELEVKFLAQSRIFGESYGLVKSAMELLESVSKAQGIPDLNGIIPTHGMKAPELGSKEKKDEPKTILDLSTPQAVTAATRVLAILKDNKSWSIDDFRTMFKNNKYTLRSKLERDLDELVGMQRLWRRASHVIAQVIMTGTNKIPFLPEKYRHLLMALMGMRVNQFMMDLHLSDIQAVVKVGRVRSSDGKLVLLRDESTLNLQIQTLMDIDATTSNDDLLITFARLQYHKDSWNNIFLEVERKSKNSDEPVAYKHLHKRMESAQIAAEKLGPLPYIHEPALDRQVQLLIAQTAYLIATEEGVRHFVWPSVQQFLQ